MNAGTGRAGIIRARDDAGSMDKLVSMHSSALSHLVSTLLRSPPKETGDALVSLASSVGMNQLCAPIQLMLHWTFCLFGCMANAGYL